MFFNATGGQKPPIADTETFHSTQKIYNKYLMDHPQTHTYSDYGTPAMVHLADGLGGLPNHNFLPVHSNLRYSVAKITTKLVLAHGGEGKFTHACMPGCIIRCSNILLERTEKQLFLHKSNLKPFT